MKLKSFLGIIALIVLFSGCEKSIGDNISQPTDSHHVTLEEALTQLDNVLDLLNLETKAQGVTREYSIADVSTVTKEGLAPVTKSGTTDELILPEELLYVVNFKDNKGAAVLSADDRTGDIVMCVTESGSIDVSDFYYVSELLSTLTPTTKSGDGEADEDFISDLGELTVPSLLLSNVILSIEDNEQGEGEDLNTKALSTETKYGPYVPVKWGQEYVGTDTSNKVFNRYTPNNYPAGCVVIATAQILLTNTNFNYTFNGYPCSRNTMLGVAHYTTPSYAGASTAQDQAGYFVYGLGESSLLCNVSYGSNGTSGTINGAKRTLEAFLYNNVTKHSGFGSSNQSLATAQLQSGRPVYMGGKPAWSLTGHAWVLDGVWGNYYHVNWGWVGCMDGYYAKGVFSTASRADYDTVYDAGTHNLYFKSTYSYTWLFNMLTYTL